MTSLKTLLALKPSVLYPAHGPHITTPTACAAHITEYIKHRQQREDEVVSLLSSVNSPGALARLLREHGEKRAEEKAAKEKYNAEFHSGKPYKPKKKAEDKDNGKDEDQEGKGKDDKDPMDAFEGDQPALPVTLLCRLLYKTDDEKIIFAATRSATAHLQKLEKDSRVKRVTVVLPKIIDGTVGEPEPQEGWQLAEPEPQSEA
jgi:hypothetical protein